MRTVEAGKKRGAPTVSVTGTVNVAIVTAITLVLDVRGVDGNTASLLLRCLVDLGVVGEARGTLLGENLGDSSSQRGLAMVDVACKERLSQLNAIAYPSATYQWC